MNRFWDEGFLRETARRPPAPGRSRFICNSCGAVFDNSRSLVNHVEEHRRECDGDCKDGKR